MLFNSLAFFVFLPVVVAIYWRLPHRGQNRFLLAASYLFYGWWDWRFLGLIALSTVVDFYVGQRVHDTREERPDKAKRWVALSVATNLGILASFKYFNFFTESAGALLSAIGFGVEPVLLSIILPVGISFYTFQTISYSVDIYRGELEPVRSIFDFALFVSFFPQLVAGPIERAKVLVPQILSERKASSVQFQDGLNLIFWGLFKKVYVADNLAPIVDSLFAASDPTGWQVLMAAYGFAFQIYCDFSGYSSIARGSAKLLGVELMVNFAYPYTARNPSDFWRKWHISLSTWLRDYLYIPLGGSRGGSFATYRNLALTMLLGGLWHGATWLFVIWGAYQGAFLIAHRLMAPALGRVPLFNQPRFSTAADAVRIFITFQFVCAGWLIFRGESLGQIGNMVE
ncbi:MAG: MBOAT family O-acyltransferase, partial [Longimicrobiales bacterium]